jgi:DNA-directed RNA polymerase specialized sigma24 family protein
VLGTHFKRTLRAAQAGDEGAFILLWRDAHPAMVRYLRVMGVGDPYDGANAGWVTVIRGLSGFEGDETAWRVWLLACARQRAEERGGRRGRSASAGRPADPSSRPANEVASLDALDIEGDDSRDRGLELTLEALRRLPLGQGEVLVLRLGAGLPVGAVADVVGTDSIAVRRSEERALERLGVDRILVAWSLDAPATARELGDEQVAAAAFRSLPRPHQGDGTRVVALLPVPGARRQGKRLGTPRTGEPGAVRGVSRSSALVAAVVALATVLAIVGVGVAAYAGILPDPLQSVLHNALGLPAPRAG